MIDGPGIDNDNKERRKIMLGKKLNVRVIYTAVLTVIMFIMMTGIALAADQTGAGTDGKAVYDLVYSGQALKEAIGRNSIAINFVWTLVAGFLVFFMQAGFAMVETGFTRAKNALHTMMMNLVIFVVGCLGFFMVGFALMFGGVGGVPSLGGGAELNGLFEIIKGWGIFGYKGFFLVTGGTYSVVAYAYFLFQVVFMDTAATIPTGAMAERFRFKPFIIYGFFISMILYPLYGNWVWGGGWLAALGRNLSLGHGAVDFAGSGVVHAVGGFCALAGALALGPRIGKYNKDGTPNAIPGHHLPMAFIGTIVLIFGWFGFNPGSTLAGTDLRIAVVAVNTMLSGVAGGFAAMLFMWLKFGKPDGSMTANGILAGLVAITAPSAFVEGWAAIIIGAVGGILVVVSVLFVERKLKVDDPVGAVSVHGVNGLWGLLALGLFADGTYGIGWNGVGATAAKGVTGLFFGDPGQLIAQLISMVVVVAWAFGASFIFFKVLNRFMRLRVKPEEELEGLDMTEIGALAYPEFSIVPGTGYSAEKVNGLKGGELT
ncbi:MAG: ammonium transporter [Actinomycetota bacterium]